MNMIKKAAFRTILQDSQSLSQIQIQTSYGYTRSLLELPKRICFYRNKQKLDQTITLAETPHYFRLDFDMDTTPIHRTIVYEE